MTARQTDPADSPSSPPPPGTPRVLLLPGWQNSGPGHWQTLWEVQRGAHRVQQSDWWWPRRGDWMARLDDVLLEDPRPTLLAAHSLGCHLVAAWAAHSAHTAWVRAALLVAPPDTERADMPPQLSNWRPMVRQRLPFAAAVLISQDDPFCAPERAQALSADWGAEAVIVGAAGHLNADSGLGDWPAAWDRLQRLSQRAASGSGLSSSQAPGPGAPGAR